MRLIDADKLLACLEMQHSGDGCQFCYYSHGGRMVCRAVEIRLNELCGVIDAQPTIDPCEDCTWVEPR